jgi:hypothetical protein
MFNHSRYDALVVGARCAGIGVLFSGAGTTLCDITMVFVPMASSFRSLKLDCCLLRDQVL